jgi:hypothetical protein
MRSSLTLALALSGAGCFNPSPPPGSYRCSEIDNACPVDQHCTCGSCVRHDDEAPCSFKLDAHPPASGTVEEHQPFTVGIRAFMGDGKTPAAHFNGAVTLSSSWGDVRVVGATGGVAKVLLVNGQATAMVSLNRETLPPQAARLTASFAVAKGTSGSIGVKAPELARSPTPVVDVPSSAQPFAFADVLVAQPDVRKTDQGWRMYFGGFARGSGMGYEFGVAQSSDNGATFKPLGSMPVFAAGGAAWDAKSITSPSVFSGAGSVNLAFAGSDSDFNGTNQIGIATSPDGVTPFALNGTMPTLKLGDCAYCAKGVEFPAVIPDPTAPLTAGGAPTGWLMFFSAGGSGDALGRATSDDGLSFVPEPAPLLAGDFFGEAILLAPRVLVDGTVLKMFYSFARVADYKPGDLCGSTLSVGYATSTDGLYWIRSPSNPVLPVGGSGWDASITAFLVGSAVPTDGVDPQNGIRVYYSTLRQTMFSALNTSCVPNGIGRAERR